MHIIRKLTNQRTQNALEKFSKEYDIQLNLTDNETLLLQNSFSYFNTRSLLHCLRTIYTAHEKSNVYSHNISVLAKDRQHGTYAKQLIHLSASYSLKDLQYILDVLKNANEMTRENLEKLYFLLEKGVQKKQQPILLLLYRKCVQVHRHSDKHIIKKTHLSAWLQLAHCDDFSDRLQYLYDIACQITPYGESTNRYLKSNIQLLLTMALPTLEIITKTIHLLSSIRFLYYHSLECLLSLSEPTESDPLSERLFLQYRLLECLHQEKLLLQNNVQSLIDLRGLASTKRFEIVDSNHILLNFIPSIFQQAYEGQLTQKMLNCMFLDVANYLRNYPHPLRFFGIPRSVSDNIPALGSPDSNINTVMEHKKYCLQNFFGEYGATFLFNSELASNCISDTLPPSYETATAGTIFR